MTGVFLLELPELHRIPAVEQKTNPQILVVGLDPELRGEFEHACSTVKNVRPINHFIFDRRQGLEAVRNRRPDLLCVEMDGDLPGFIRFAEEAHVISPETTVTAIYRPDAFESESAAIIAAIRAHVQDFIQRPLSTDELDRVLDRLTSQKKANARGLGPVVSFISNKGGVGKSTMSVSTACALGQRHPDRVLLVDASIQLGVCSAMLDIRAETSILDAVLELDRLDETLLRELAVPHESGIRLLAAPVDAAEAAQITEDAMARIISIGRRAFDYVVVDTFPMIDSLVLTVLDACDLVFFVLQGTVPHVLGGRQFLKVLERLRYPADRIRLVVNQNYENFAGNLRLSDIEEHIGREVDHAIPYKKGVLVAANAGRPFVLKQSRFMGFGKAVAGICDDIEERDVRERNREEE